MGTLIYSPTLQFEIEDCTLAHLKSVMLTKLRKQESFSLTIIARSDAVDTPVSTTIWVSPQSNLGFRVSEAEGLEISDKRLASLMRESSGKDGLVIEGA